MPENGEDSENIWDIVDKNETQNQNPTARLRRPMKKTEKSWKVKAKLSDQKLGVHRTGKTQKQWEWSEESEVTRPQGGSHAEGVLMEVTMASPPRQSCPTSGEKRNVKTAQIGRLTTPGTIYVQNSMLYVVVHRKEGKDEAGRRSSTSITI